MGRDNTGRCRGCQAPMTWALTDRGKGIPLDPDPVPDGNLVQAGENADDGRMIVRYLAKGEEPEPGVARYKTHFATCENADEFRRTK